MTVLHLCSGSRGGLQLCRLHVCSGDTGDSAGRSERPHQVAVFLKGQVKFPFNCTLSVQKYLESLKVNTKTAKAKTDFFPGAKNKMNDGSVSCE